MATAFSPTLTALTSIANISVSGTDDLTVTAIASNYALARAAPPAFKTGLKYFEISIVAASTTPGQDALGLQFSPDIAGIYFDFSAGLMWVTKDGVNFNNTVGSSPSTGLLGNAFSVTGPFFFAVSLYTNQNFVTANFGQGPFSLPVASGFSAWGAAEQFNPADANSNLVVGADGVSIYATQTSSGWAMVRSIGSKSSGKVYLEIPLACGASNGIIVGLANSSASLGSQVGSSGDSAGWQCQASLYGFSGPVGAYGYADLNPVDSTSLSPNEFYYASNGYGEGNFGLEAWGSGDVISYAVDEVHNKLWRRRNGNLWENISGSDPATNTGGVSVPAGIAQIFSNLSVIGSKQVLNTLGPFINSLPAGAVGWDASGPPPTAAQNQVTIMCVT
jgi:hypothetical protein